MKGITPRITKDRMLAAEKAKDKLQKKFQELQLRRHLYREHIMAKRKQTWSSNQDTFTIAGAICKYSTDSALLIEHVDFDEAMWFPLSQVSPDSEVQKQGDEGDLIVTYWIAKQKELV